MKSEQDIKERLDILGELYRRHENKEIALALRQLYWVLETEWPQRTIEQTVVYR
jgi:predicted transcriptional regulator